MKKLLSLLAATTMLAQPVLAQDAIKEFNIGLLGGENAQDRLSSAECYRAAIEKVLGVPTKLFAPADYDGVIQGQLGGTIDMAWHGPSSYAKLFLTDPEAVEVALTTKHLNGTIGYYSIGFARKDSGINSIEDAKGKAFAFADPNSASGYLIPYTELSTKYGDLKSYFSETVFSGGHEQTIVGVAKGDYPAGVSWADGDGNWEDGFNAGAFRKATDAGLVDMNDLVEIWRSDLIPEGPMVLRKSLPQDVKDKVIKLSEDLAETDKDCFYAVSGGENLDFVPITQDYYKTVIESRKLLDQQG